MELIVFGGIAVCVVFFLVMASVQSISIEKDIVDLTALIENRVTKLYNGEL